MLQIKAKNLIINTILVSFAKFFSTKYSGFIKPLTNIPSSCRSFIVADFETIALVSEKREHAVFMLGYKYSNSPENPIFVKSISQNCSYESLKIKSRELILEILFKVNEENSKSIVIYFHNLGKFDGIFIIDALLASKINPKVIYRSGQIYEIKYGNIIIRDSFLLLNKSLSALAKDFLNESKVSYDVKNITLSRFKKEHREIRNYLEKDVVLLLRIIQRFQKIIFSDFSFDITQAITGASLAIKIFRLNFLKEDLISLSSVNQHHYTFLEESYRGGIVDVYKPYVEGKIYEYDINSSYPSTIATKKIPTGIPEWIDSFSKSFNLDTFFGFIKVTVFVPKDTYIPLLGYLDKENSVYIYPTGEFVCTVFSEELKLAVKEGARVVKYHTGLKYQSENIFHEFIHDLYGKRIKAKKEGNQAYILIYKLLINSLYGRFGIKKDVPRTIIIHKDELKDLETVFAISNLYPIIGDYFILNLHEIFNYKKHVKDFKTIQRLNGIAKAYKSITKHINIATHISSAITAYSRIEIHQIKKHIINNNIEVYYSDTDNVFTNIKLEDKFVGTKLGQYKLENIYTKAVFLSSKVYAAKNDFKETLKFKSLPKHITIELTFDEIYEWYKEKAPFTRNYIKPIKGSFRNLTVSDKVISFHTYFTFIKRSKVFNNEGLWISTKPIDLLLSDKMEKQSIPKLKSFVTQDIKESNEFIIELAFSVDAENHSIIRITASTAIEIIKHFPYYIPEDETFSYKDLRILVNAVVDDHSDINITPTSFRSSFEPSKNTKRNQSYAESIRKKLEEYKDTIFTDQVDLILIFVKENNQWTHTKEKITPRIYNLSKYIL